MAGVVDNVRILILIARKSVGSQKAKMKHGGKKEKRIQCKQWERGLKGRMRPSQYYLGGDNKNIGGRH